MLQEEFKKIEGLAMNIKAFIQTEIELIKLRFAEKLSKSLSNFIALMIYIWLILIFILFISISLAIFIGEWLGKISIGFFIVSLLYLFIAFITWHWREKLIRIPILNGILKQLFENKNGDEENQ
jgi:predicted membrane channel-forming protein YqfA (hemolysin III family)